MIWLWQELTSNQKIATIAAGAIIILLGWLLITWYTMIKTSDFVKSATRAVIWIMITIVTTAALWIIIL